MRSPPRQSTPRPSRVRRSRPSNRGRRSYSFTPSATDADGDSLIFGIEAKPAWATVQHGDRAACRARRRRSTSECIAASSCGCRTAKAQTVLPRVRPDRRGADGQQSRADDLRHAGDVGRSSMRSTRSLPTASDPDGQPLTFSIRNRPSWAAFDTATGRLQGHAAAATSAPSPTSRSPSATGRWPSPLPSFTIVVTPPPVNRAPVISGAPMTTVEAGTRVRVRAHGERSRRRSADVRDHGPAELGDVQHDHGRLARTPPVGHDRRRSATS